MWACSLPVVLSVYMCMYVHLAVCVNYGLVSGTCFNNFCRVDYQTIQQVETIICPRTFLIGNNHLTAKSCTEPNRLHCRHVYDLLETCVATCRYSVE